MFIKCVNTCGYYFDSRLCFEPHDNYSEWPIFITSWKALYFYRIYFEAATSTQKFANSFYGTPFFWTPPGVPPSKDPPFWTPFWGPLFRHFTIIILPMFLNNTKSYSKTGTNSLNHSIFITSWEALYFYRFYFEAVTSMQKFANSFYGPPFFGPLRGLSFRHFTISIWTQIFKWYLVLNPKLVQSLQKHQIFPTSWKALYFYRFYFEAVTSMQKFANSFSKDPLFLDPSGGPTFGGPYLFI